MKTMGRWQRESLSLPRCSHLFVFTRPRVGTNMAHIALLKKMVTSPNKNAPGRGERSNIISRFDVGLPPTKLLLRLREQLLVQQVISVEAMFPSRALVAVRVEHIFRN